MKQFSYVLTRPYLPFAKQVSNLVKEVSRFSSRVSLRQNDKDISIREARKPMNSGSRITITVDGRDEEAAVAAIQNYVVANL